MRSAWRRFRHLLAWNKRWLFHRHLSWAARLGYYPRMAFSMLRWRFAGQRLGTIRFLGNEIVYHDSLIPILLLQYPDEIRTYILDNVTGPIRTVLDLGANIGQFALTLAALGDDVESIDVFEPNPAMFALLERNVSHLPGVRCFNFGIGPEGSTTLYFTPGRSVIASMIAENARYRPDSELESVEASLVSDVAAVTGRAHYDLVKIDVEGYEYDVLEAMKGIEMRYLFLEVTGLGKEKPYLTSELHRLLLDKLGPYEIRFQSAGGSEALTFEVLFEFVDERR